MKKITKPFWLALQFMSRLPTPQYESISAKEMGASISWFPVVGLIIGLGLVAIAQLHLWLTPEITAGLVLAFWAWITGALHLDGLADSADGWLGGVGNHQRALEIMKDSRIGTGGGVALTVLLILKWTVLIEIVTHQAWLFLLLAPFVARLASISLMPVTKYVSLNGIAEQMFLHLNKWHIMIWLGVFCGFLAWLNPMVLLFVFLGLLPVWVWIRWVMIRITGGMTGDTAGTMTEVIEVMWMLLIVIMLINNFKLLD